MLGSYRCLIFLDEMQRLDHIILGTIRHKQPSLHSVVFLCDIFVHNTSDCWLQHMELISMAFIDFIGFSSEHRKYILLLVIEDTFVRARALFLSWTWLHWRRLKSPNLCVKGTRTACMLYHRIKKSKWRSHSNPMMPVY